MCLPCTYSRLFGSMCGDQKAYRQSKMNLQNQSRIKTPHRNNCVCFLIVFFIEQTAVEVLEVFGATLIMIPIHFNIPAPHSERGRKLLGTRWLLQTWSDGRHKPHCHNGGFPQDGGTSKSFKPYRPSKSWNPFGCIYWFENESPLFIWQNVCCFLKRKKVFTPRFSLPIMVIAIKVVLLRQTCLG